jgi:segregation and condensation protein B
MNLNSQLESLLFAAASPLKLSDLSKILKREKSEIKEALASLSDYYQQQDRGFSLINNGDKYQLTTSEKNSKLVAKLLAQEVSGELTRPSLEALTIIAYKSPVTKIEIEKIRGVNCSLILRNLLIRGLIEEKYDKQKQVSFYNLSLDFIRHLGISDCSKLANYEKLNNIDIYNFRKESKE